MVEVENAIVAVVAWEGVYPRAPWKEGDFPGDGHVIEELADGRVRVHVEVASPAGARRHIEPRDFDDAREAVRYVIARDFAEGIDGIALRRDPA